MYRKENNINPRSQNLSYFGAVLKCFLVFIFGLLLFCQNSTFFPDKPEEQSASDQENSVLKSDDFLTHAHYPFHIPLGSIPTPNEPEYPDEENETKENNDEKAWSFLLWCLNSENRFNKSLKNSQYLQLILSIKNRPTVSLFILHQSWKIYSA